MNYASKNNEKKMDPLILKKIDEIRNNSHTIMIIQWNTLELNLLFYFEDFLSKFLRWTKSNLIIENH